MSAHTHGYEATCTRDRGQLGRLDDELITLAVDGGFAFVTNNHADFRGFCGNADLQAGLVILPQGRRDDQRGWLDRAIAHIERQGARSSRSTRQDMRVEFELTRCEEGDRWFPWNYGRTYASGRVGVARFVPEPGLVVVNAVDPAGRILGSCSLRVGPRHSEYVLGDEEYRYGALAAGPAYFWKDNERCPWIVLLKSFWVRPAERRNGIARAFAEFVRSIGLPAYLAFANKKVEAWFENEFRPSGERSRLQRKIASAMRTKRASAEIGREADFTVYVQAEASAWLIWRSWHGGGAFERVGLEEVLSSPDRMDVWAADSGEEFEVGFSDSAFAHDCSFGYVLEPWCDGWGRTLDLSDLSEDDADHEAAEDALRKESVFAAGAIDGWITDTTAMRAYATVRYFLRNLEWREFRDVNDAARELFVRDLREQPRGLHRFNALVSPIHAPPALRADG